MIAIKRAFQIEDLIKIKSLSSKYSGVVPQKYVGLIGTVYNINGLFISVNTSYGSFIVDSDDLLYLGEGTAEYIAYHKKLEESKTDRNTTLADIKDVLCEVYGDENVDQQDESFVFRIPERVITDSRMSHTYKDFYVQFDFSWHEPTGTYLLSSTKGIRGQLTFAEYSSYYGFSYCPDVYEWSGFCFGSGNRLCTLANRLEVDGYDLDSFIEFAYTFKNYLGWETPEGAPHKYINNIRIHPSYLVSNKNYSDSEIKMTYLKFLELIDKPDFTLSNNVYKVIINQKFKDLVNSVCTNDQRLFYNKQTNSYLDNLNMPKILAEIKKFNDDDNEDYNKGDIHFKGDIFTTKIVDTSLNVVDKSNSYVATEVAHLVADILDKNYNKYMTKQYTKKNEHFITKVY